MDKLEALKGKLQAFADARDWDQFHSPKNLSMALSVEASELVECFQWLTEEQSKNLSLEQRDAINDDFYDEHIKKAPVFISPDALKLSEFLKKSVKYGDSDNIMYRIEHGKIKPSKNLADALASMLDGNPEFLMRDEQKLVYETALDLARKAQQGHKQTLIVKGGLDTGKSVVAINLLTELIKRELLTQYVSKNAAPHEVFKKMLTGSRKKTHIDNMFKGSGGYIDTPENTFGALLVDEAHRLNEKSGLYGNLGENQIKELINASRFNVFFIDEAQQGIEKRFRFKVNNDYGRSTSKALIMKRYGCLYDNNID